MSKEDNEPDYLHPDGSKKQPPQNGEEKQNQERVEELTELVAKTKEENKDNSVR